MPILIIKNASISELCNQDKGKVFINYLNEAIVVTVSEPSLKSLHACTDCEPQFLQCPPTSPLIFRTLLQFCPVHITLSSRSFYFLQVIICTGDGRTETTSFSTKIKFKKKKCDHKNGEMVVPTLDTSSDGQQQDQFKRFVETSSHCQCIFSFSSIPSDPRSPRVPTRPHPRRIKLRYVFNICRYQIEIRAFKNRGNDKIVDCREDFYSVKKICSLTFQFIWCKCRLSFTAHPKVPMDC